ncbi:type 1 glutamine amidotransferase [Lysinibacillus telephonicus]|uniref:type 1 glutamine amidotransferase n=1 Tax=Lysinibacillus telephonicus TaxID=1714840 RepID=UPI00163AE781|nr:type 1 glutamine amidotransferase [Lysinibacillus telephonicus]
MNIDIIQHVSFEGPGLIAAWALSRNYSLRIHKIFEGAAIPQEENIEFLIVLGGPMSVNDEDFWINDERELIENMARKKKPVFGVCFGAQQISKVLGGEVLPCKKEVGWGEVTLKNTPFQTNKTNFNVLHWHGEQFTIPSKATRLFTNTYCENQGIMFENLIGVQFHLETDRESLQKIVQNDSSFINNSVYNQSAEQISSFEIPKENKELLYTILDSLASIKGEVSYE